MASSNANVRTPVPFPRPDSNSPTSSTTPPQHRSRTSTNASATSGPSRLRTASIKLLEANPPPGIWAATGTIAAKTPSLSEIRGGAFGTSGWKEEPQKHKAGKPRGKSSPRIGTSHATSPGTPRASDPEPFPAVTEEDMNAAPARERAPRTDMDDTPSSGTTERDMDAGLEPKQTTGSKEPVLQRPSNERQYSNGYIPPPKIPWTTSTIIALKAFSKWVLTPAGFLITIYCLNVVAWGGMIFLLLCNAAPAMCKPTCDDLQSPRRKWIEVDSQILNALFCVTGFGLAPWRFRDVYWWGWWRLGGAKRRETGIRRLAGIHNKWYRLPGSEALSSDASATTADLHNPAVPIPVEKMANPPPTGHHAPPTKSWKMDFVIWMNAWNTFFQVVLCFYMWHYNRIDRPSWATGVFVALACIVAGAGGIVIMIEGKRIKKFEGVPASQWTTESKADIEMSSLNGNHQHTDGAADVSKT